MCSWHWKNLSSLPLILNWLLKRLCTQTKSLPVLFLWKTAIVYSSCLLISTESVLHHSHSPSLFLLFECVVIFVVQHLELLLLLWKLERGRLVNPRHFLKKRGLVSIECGLLQNFKGPLKIKVKFFFNLKVKISYSHHGLFNHNTSGKI
jgi:hypothetical protein